MEQLVKVRGLVKHFPVEGSDDVVRAVDGVSFDIFAGETLGLVGESGCGKSTLGRVLAGIIPQTVGEVLWRGRDRRTLRGEDARTARLSAQMIFQDPLSSLNPRKRVVDIVGEAPVGVGRAAPPVRPAPAADLVLTDRSREPQRFLRAS